MPALVPCGDLPARLPESTLGQTLAGKQRSAVSWGCGSAGTMQMKSLEMEAGERECHLTPAGCGHRLHHVHKRSPGDGRQSSFTQSLNRTMFPSVSNYCQSPSGEDRLEKLLKLPET